MIKANTFQVPCYGWGSVACEWYKTEPGLEPGLHTYQIPSAQIYQQHRRKRFPQEKWKQTYWVNMGAHKPSLNGKKVCERFSDRFFLNIAPASLEQKIFSPLS